VEPTGLLALATDRVFCAMTGERPGNPDGMQVDQEGNVYCTGPGGVWILDSAGKYLGTIPTEETTTNMAWGDDDWSTLYFTTRHTLARLRLKIPGYLEWYYSIELISIDGILCLPRKEATAMGS
jgi:gluconolactonase